VTQRYTVMAQMNGAFGYQLTGVRLEASHLLQMVAGVELVAITSQPQLNGRRGESRSTPPTTHTHTTAQHRTTDQIVSRDYYDRALQRSPPGSSKQRLLTSPRACRQRA
jgi:hypothetical protein